MPGKKVDATRQREITRAGLGPASESSPAFAITPTLVADQVYEALRTAILTGELAGGSPLRVRDVAAMVGTSVMPVREAIRRLEETGLATRVAAHRGAVVREFTVGELIHIYEVRATLEIEAARRGAANVTDADVARMEAACARMQKAVAERRVWDALDDDEDLLRTLYSAGSNPVLMGVIETLWRQCRPYKVIGATEAIEHDDSSLWTPQPAILEAARSRDVKAATKLTKESLSSARQRLEKRLVPH
ncbi:GntR family transcriptional regulator [Pseudarthrobacter sp. HLT3-5]|uniref:GntR family transcriptional regulator n=1 Tax=Pseudarthrobacter cellobiosi TaxID=2953654 RepID=UPI00208DF8CF|nr:GntR family transcriptional regulator [Pseudarthrobacter sp. HLT3-5]MCO4272943.1 GntR family transcriptional regulator [Pseudarthrobacter sp. HLT3-5]